MMIFVLISTPISLKKNGSAMKKQYLRLLKIHIYNILFFGNYHTDIRVVYGWISTCPYSIYKVVEMGYTNFTRLVSNRCSLHTNRTFDFIRTFLKRNKIGSLSNVVCNIPTFTREPSFMNWYNF